MKILQNSKILNPKTAKYNKTAHCGKLIEIASLLQIVLQNVLELKPILHLDKRKNIAKYFLSTSPCVTIHLFPHNYNSHLTILLCCYLILLHTVYRINAVPVNCLLYFA